MTFSCSECGTRPDGSTLQLGVDTPCYGDMKMSPVILETETPQRSKSDVQKRVDHSLVPIKHCQKLSKSYTITSC